MLNYPIVDGRDDLTDVADPILREAGVDRRDQRGTLTFAGMNRRRPPSMSARERPLCLRR